MWLVSIPLPPADRALAAAGGGPEEPGLISVPMFIRQPDGPPIAIMFIMLAFCRTPSA
jgi:hypothetical protein